MYADSISTNIDWLRNHKRSYLVLLLLIFLGHAYLFFFYCFINQSSKISRMAVNGYDIIRMLCMLKFIHNSLLLDCIGAQYFQEYGMVWLWPLYESSYDCYSHFAISFHSHKCLINRHDFVKKRLEINDSPWNNLRFC